MTHTYPPLAHAGTVPAAVNVNFWSASAMGGTAVPEALKDSLLSDACARAAAVEVRLQGKQSDVPLKSRFIKTCMLGGERAILIQAPALSGMPVELRPREEVEVLTVIGEERYAFRAAVRGPSKVTLKNGFVASATALSYPPSLTKLQNRASYRARIPAGEPITLRCIARDAEKDAGSGAEGVVEFKAVAVDISAGGIGFKVMQRHERHARQGAMWILIFRLPGRAEAVKLAAIVRHVAPIEGTAKLAIGAEFADLSTNIEGRRASNAIEQYVARRQREEIRGKGSHAT